MPGDFPIPIVVVQHLAGHLKSRLPEVLGFRTALTRLMDWLIEFDLMAREEDRNDRRRVKVRRTRSCDVLRRTGRHRPYKATKREAEAA